MSKIVDESILVFSTISLTKILSRNSLHFMDIRVFIVVYMRNMKSHFSAKQGILATQSCEWNESQVNCQARLSIFVLQCSNYRDSSASCMLHTCGILVSCRSQVTRKIQSQETFKCTHTHLNFFTLSHTQPLHNSHLITEYIIAEIQANLVQYKANT